MPLSQKKAAGCIIFEDQKVTLIWTVNLNIINYQDTQKLSILKGNLPHRRIGRVLAYILYEKSQRVSNVIKCIVCFVYVVIVQ